MTIRTFNIISSFCALVFLSVPFCIIWVLVKLTSKGPAIHWSKRIGKENIIFLMPKFRTMRLDTPQLATHLLDDGTKWLTPVGAFLRKTSLDELPQLISVLNGKMSLVGPRPALFNQDDLKKLRTEYNVHTIPPGITGWAQVNGRDELSIPEKVKFDKYYLDHRSLLFDVKIIILTIYKVLKRSNVSH